MENGNGALQVVKDQNGVMPASSWQTMKEQATMLVKSGFLPPAVNTPEKAITIALAGKELGIGFMESLRSINVIQGKPTVSPQLMLALANRTGQLEDQSIDAGDDKCVVTIKRKGRKAYTNEFGIKEATDLGLMAKDNYRKQKKTMFQWRAIAANLRVTFPDVVLGLYTPEEMGANVQVSENEEMVVSQAEPLKVVATPVESKPSPVIVEPKRDSLLKDDVKIGEAIITVASIEVRMYAPEKYRYIVKDAEGVVYTTFSMTIHDFCEEARINGRTIVVKFQYQPGKKGTKFEGQTFLNLVEADYVEHDIIKDH